MKKIKALTLIETLLVIVVIALILVVATLQVQRYQQARLIQSVRTVVQQIANYGFELYTTYCYQMSQYAQHIYLICPTAAANAYGEPSDGQYCTDSNFSVINPFFGRQQPQTPDNANYLVWLYFTNNAISVQLPIPQTFWKDIGIKNSGTPQSLVGDVKFQQLISKLQPTTVFFAGQNYEYTPGIGFVNTPQLHTNQLCPKLISNANVCMVWNMSISNWGSLQTETTNNQTLSNQLDAFATQYAPTKSEWQTIQGSSKGAHFSCPALTGHQIYQETHSPSSP